MRVTEIVMTCNACPSQWEGKTECGHMVYIRYRWGWLSVRISPIKTNNVEDAVVGIEIYGEQIGNDLDGSLGYEEMRDAVHKNTELIMPTIKKMMI